MKPNALLLYTLVMYSSLSYLLHSLMARFDVIHLVLQSDISSHFLRSL